MGFVWVLLHLMDFQGKFTDNWCFKTVDESFTSFFLRNLNLMNSNGFACLHEWQFQSFEENCWQF